MTISKIQPSLNASVSVAARCARGPHYARTICNMACHLLRTGMLPQTKQGKGGHHESLLNKPEINSALQRWVKGMRPAKLRRYVNEFLLPELKIESTICESTAMRWLKKLGFSLCRVQKGVYVDGHERADVVAARQEFINYLDTQILPFCYTYEGPELKEIPPSLKDGEKIHYPIFHDETCVHANDQANFVWMREGEQPLRNKSCGRIVHVSDFIVEHGGRLSLTEAEIAVQNKLPAQPIEPSANYDPWWDMPQLITQTKNAIEIFEVKYPNGVGVFIFDCSSAHEAFAADALLAHKMNRGSGGKQPIMRDTVIPSTGQPQSMVFPSNYEAVDKDGNSLAGRPKGMEEILHERGLLRDLELKHGNKLVGICKTCKLSQAAREAASKEAKEREDEIEGSGVEGLNSRGVSEMEQMDLDRAKNCCMQRVLSLQKDFREEKPLLQ
ncbi:hypothetical protein BDZ94DRAFT_1370850, partial [Collybia nuda]